MEGWQVNRKNPAKICHYAEKGEACMRVIFVIITNYWFGFSVGSAQDRAQDNDIHTEGASLKRYSQNLATV
jgi:hypothetical protein